MADLVLIIRTQLFPVAVGPLLGQRIMKVYQRNANYKLEKSNARGALLFFHFKTYEWNAEAGFEPWDLYIAWRY